MPPSSTPTTTHLSIFWRLQLIAWGTLSVLTLPLKHSVFGSWNTAALITAYQLPLTLALSAILHGIYCRVRPDRRTFFQAALILLVAGNLAGAADTTLGLLINQKLGAQQPVGLGWLLQHAFRTAIYLIWSLGYFLIQSLHQNREMAFQAAVADERHRFELLRYQLNPNFLAKSLSTISQHIVEHPEAARAMTSRLADFYQKTLQHTDHGQTATIGDELALVRAYLDIEQLRRRPALKVSYEVDDSLLSLPLPPILLLPLAEKAVLAGGRPGEPIEIIITAQRTEDGQVLLEVANSGSLPRVRTPAAAASPEVTNVEASLERHFPGRHRFVLRQDSFMTRATVYLALA